MRRLVFNPARQPRYLLLLGASLLLFLTACANRYIPNPANTIILLSQSTIVLTSQGEQADIEAMVQRPDSSEDERATIAFSSSNPDSVKVSPNGQVTAQSDLGSAVITLSSEALMPVAVTVIVAQPNERTHFVTDNDVVSAAADQSEIILQKNSSTRNLEIGDVIISGEHGGVFASILAVEVQADTVAIEGRLASLPEAFDELDLDLVGPSMPVTASFESSTVSVHTASGRLVQQVLLDDIECEAGGSAASVSFSGGSIESNLDLSPIFRHRVTPDLSNPGICGTLPLECIVVEEFTLGIDAQASAVVTLGQLSITGGLSANVECKLELQVIPIIPLPILGPLSIAGTVTPDITVTIGGSYNGASLTFKGPELNKSVELVAGFSYSDGGGFETLGSGEPKFLGPGVTWGDATAKIQNELSLSLEPAFNASPGISLLIGVNELFTFKLVTVSLLGGAEVTFELPLDMHALDYQGPRWKLYFGGSADLNALLENFEVVKSFLEFVGLTEKADQLFSLDLKLFEIKTTLAEGPEPTVSAEQQGTSRTVDLSAEGGLDNGTPVVFYAAEEVSSGVFGDLEEIASANVQGGTATTTWEPDGAGSEVYAVTVRVESIFGEDLPYGPEENAQVELGGGIVLEPESLSVTLNVGESSDETVSLVSQGLAADYEVVNSQPHVVIGNPQGSVEADDTVDLNLAVTCPDEAGSYPQGFDLLFTDGDGEVIDEDVPEVLSIDLTCNEGPEGFALRSQGYSATVGLGWFGPGNPESDGFSGEGYHSNDARGTGTYTIFDVNGGTDDSMTIEVGPLGFSDVGVVGSRTLSCPTAPDRTSSGSASNSTSWSVQGSVITFAGDLSTAYSISSKVPCGGERAIDGLVAFSDIRFQLSTEAQLTGSWTCDGSFRAKRANVATDDIWLVNTTANLLIFDIENDSCEVDQTIPAGLYHFIGRITNGTETSVPEGGLSVDRDGSYEFTITLPE